MRLFLGPLAWLLAYDTFPTVHLLLWSHCTKCMCILLYTYRIAVNDTICSVLYCSVLYSTVDISSVVYIYATLLPNRPRQHVAYTRGQAYLSLGLNQALGAGLSYDMIFVRSASTAESRHTTRQEIMSHIGAG
jgi:hypothetical protein